MTAQYGVGLIGAGWIAGEYAKVFRNHPLTEVIGLYNRTPGKASTLMQTYCYYSDKPMPKPIAPRKLDEHSFAMIKFT